MKPPELKPRKEKGKGGNERRRGEEERRREERGWDLEAPAEGKKNRPRDTENSRCSRFPATCSHLHLVLGRCTQVEGHPPVRCPSPLRSHCSASQVSDSPGRDSGGAFTSPSSPSSPSPASPIAEARDARAESSRLQLEVLDLDLSTARRLGDARPARAER